MSDYFTKSKLYDKNGILLLSNGQRVKDTMIAKLKGIENYIPEESINLNYRQSAALAPIAKAFGVRKQIHDKHLLEKPNKVLNNIIFESKYKPCWVYANALFNYVDWLYTHSVDVAMISLMLAAEMGYSDDELFYLGLGAFLHDIGKLLVPKSIIQKPGALTDAEMVYMRQHCELGLSSLEQFDFPKECNDIVLQHHERLDGSGYPKGLKGDEICRNARIVMVADAFDAITSARPYKNSKDAGTAIRLLRNDKGKYCEELIDLLEKLLEQHGADKI